MKMPTDLIKMYKEIHGWVGIVSGLALFVAFFAGSLTMFEEPLQRWASPPTTMPAPPSLEETPGLVAAVLAAHPEAAKGYEIHLKTNAAQPARVTWTTRKGREEGRAGRTIHYAAFAPDGSLVVQAQGPSSVARWIDELHQKVGLPFGDAIASPIMGGVALLYTVALVSGLVVLLPSLVGDLFALRIGRNVKRMWLDVHNLLGLFSLPFHLIMALTAVTFAFHDQFYASENALFGAKPAAHAERPAKSAPPERRKPGRETQALTPVQLVARLREQAPGFEPETLVHGQPRRGMPALRVQGHDARYGLRSPTYGIAGIDEATGKIISTDYMPGMQDGWAATVSSFFSLHFGNFGGAPVRWAYFALGMGGACLFYTGNLLWVESRRKRERRSGAVQQTRATRILGALTVGVPMGTMAGIALTLAAARVANGDLGQVIHSIIYYVVFLIFTIFALVRGAARASSDLAWGCAVAALTIPVSSLFTLQRGHDGVVLWLIDAFAVVFAACLAFAARRAAARAQHGPRDSVWAAPRAIAG